LSATEGIVLQKNAHLFNLYNSGCGPALWVWTQIQILPFTPPKVQKYEKNNQRQKMDGTLKMPWLA